MSKVKRFESSQLIAVHLPMSKDGAVSVIPAMFIGSYPAWGTVGGVGQAHKGSNCLNLRDNLDIRGKRSAAQLSVTVNDKFK